MIGQLVLRLTIWFLLTADVSVANIIIGVLIAFLLPRSYTAPESLRSWLRAMGKIAVAIPQAFVEAFEIIIRPHNYEDVIIERVSPNRSPGLVFLDIFLITFTPKTIVSKYDKEGWYEVHRIRRRKKS